MDKINIVSSQAVLKMPYFGMHTRSMSSSPLVNRLVNKSTAQARTRHQWAAISIHQHYGFVCGRHDAAWQPGSRNPPDWNMGCVEATGWAQESLAFLDASAVQLLHVRSVLEHCPAATQLLPDTAYRWQQYDVIMTSWSSIEEVSKRYHQNFLLCNNNEITACIADLFKSFCEEVYVVAFFKVMQQQTIGEVGSSIMCLWADNFCLQQWKNY